MSTSGQVVRYARGGNRRRKGGVPDLNEPLPVENLEHLAAVALSVGSGIPVAHDGPGQEPVGSAQPALIDLDDFDDTTTTVPNPATTVPNPAGAGYGDDDDVVLSSPRAFEEAKNKSRRIRRTRAVVIDVESGSTTTLFCTATTSTSTATTTTGSGFGYLLVPGLSEDHLLMSDHKVWSFLLQGLVLRLSIKAKPEVDV
ncbi:hypothetical protein Tco_0753637 [Tanacetum coccineum]